MMLMMMIDTAVKIDPDSHCDSLVKNIQLVYWSLKPFLVKNKKVFVHVSYDGMLICSLKVHNSCSFQSLLVNLKVDDHNILLLLLLEMRMEELCDRPFFSTISSFSLIWDGCSSGLLSFSLPLQQGAPPGGFGGSLMWFCVDISLRSLDVCIDVEVKRKMQSLIIFSNIEPV